MHGSCKYPRLVFIYRIRFPLIFVYGPSASFCPLISGQQSVSKNHLAFAGGQGTVLYVCLWCFSLNKTYIHLYVSCHAWAVLLSLWGLCRSLVLVTLCFFPFLIWFTYFPSALHCLLAALILIHQIPWDCINIHLPLMLSASPLAARCKKRTFRSNTHIIDLRVTTCFFFFYFSVKAQTQEDF